MGMKYVLWEMRHIESSRKLTQQQITSSTRPLLKTRATSGLPSMTRGCHIN
ncbi:hypothetical protein GBAR_LOCUS15405 [Geodia barretti]|uniref:Uncharacterized protein n=1 Tax=Geodia barretti TaxID=519541 RepID=A0AA35SB80_GEOBA|nr:hypothetical protein GBAR_LOCUS15405 [Geodia barretti]